MYLDVDFCTKDDIKNKTGHKTPEYFPEFFFWKILLKIKNTVTKQQGCYLQVWHDHCQRYIKDIDIPSSPYIYLKELFFSKALGPENLKTTTWFSSFALMYKFCTNTILKSPNHIISTSWVSPLLYITSYILYTIIYHINMLRKHIIIYFILYIICYHYISYRHAE